MEWRGYEARRWQQWRQARRVLESVSLSLRLTNDILHSAFPKYVVSSLHGCYSRLPACVAFPFFPPPPSSSEASLEGRETEKTLAFSRLPWILKICKEDRKKRSFNNIPPEFKSLSRPLLLLLLLHYFTIKASGRERVSGLVYSASYVTTYFSCTVQATRINDSFGTRSFSPKLLMFSTSSNMITYISTQLRPDWSAKAIQYTSLLFHTYVSMMNSHEVKMVGLPRD